MKHVCMEYSSSFMIIPLLMQFCEYSYKGYYYEQVFMEGGNSCVNGFVVGSIIGAKKGVNHVVLSAPVTMLTWFYCSFLRRISFIEIILINSLTSFLMLCIFLLFIQQTIHYRKQLCISVLLAFHSGISINDSICSRFRFSRIKSTNDFLSLVNRCLSIR